MNNQWTQLIKIRDICNISIEEKRAAKEIGSSLEATLIISLSKKQLDLIKEVDLAELCITSSVIVKESNNEQIYVETKKAEGNKCPVCWKINKDKCLRHQL